MALPGVLEEAELIRRGDVAPVDAIQAAVARIEAVDEELGSLVYRRYDRAADEAARAAHSAPFRGVPILVKDFLCEMANEPTYQGLGLAKERDWRAPEDSVITMRLRDAGFAMLGRTNTSQLALTGTADPPGFPRTANPWGKDVTPGGSSGGSAAAVASGLVAAAHGNDGLGSIRVPASFCGLVGLKPSRGLISSAPAPEALGGVVGQGVLTRSVVDTAAMLDVLAGSVSADLYIAPRPAQSYVDALQVPLPALRIGVVIDSGSAHTTSSESSDAVRKTADVLQSLGHHVFETTVAEAFADELAELNALRSASGTAAVLTAWGSKLQQELTADDVEPFTWWTAERGRAMSAPLLASALGRLQVLTRTIVAQWERFDVLLTPACAIPAPHISWLSPTVDPETVFARNQELFAFTQAFNITGQPAIAVPATLDDRGIPIGVQLVGRPFDDSLLVKVAHQLEAHSHWPSLVENHATVPATFPRMQK